MFASKSTLFVTAILAVVINFEFRAVNELEKTHFGWYCFLSIDMNRTPGKKSGGYFDREFRNIFINSEQIDEIRNQITDILEREDDDDEKNSDFNDEGSDTSSGF